MRVAKLCFLRPGHRISLIDCVHGCYVKKKVWMLEQLILAVQRACKNFLPGIVVSRDQFIYSLVLERESRELIYL